MAYNKIQEIIKSETAKSAKQLAMKKIQLVSESSTNGLIQYVQKIKCFSSDSLQFQTGVTRAYGALCGRVRLFLKAQEFISALFIDIERFEFRSFAKKREKTKRGCKIPEPKSAPKAVH